MIIPHLIVGGGLAGIAIANTLAKAGAPFLLLEAAPRLGGRVDSELTAQACFEFGPNSFSDKSPAIFALLGDLGLMETLLSPTPAAKNRYILKHGRLVRLPAAPPELLTTGALSFRGKLRFLREFFLPPGKPDGRESVDAFFTRHFGAEVARYFADPFVSGIFAGDPRRLSLADAFPKMAAAEAQSASILRYLIKQKKSGAVSPQSYELRGGLRSIFDAAAAKWPAAIRLQEPVTSLTHCTGASTVTTPQNTYRCEHLYLTIPAYDAAPLLAPHSAPLAQALAQIEYPPVAVAHLRVPKTERYPFNGFGLLIPSTENRRILGVLWNSSVFPELFPDRTHHYLTVYAGGVRGRAIVAQDDAALIGTIQAQLRDLFTLTRDPECLHLTRHPRAIPQYTLDYGALKPAITTALTEFPQLHLAGNYLGGISIPDAVAHAAALAQSVLDQSTQATQVRPSADCA